MQPDRVIRRLWRCPPIAPAVFGVSAGGELALAIEPGRTAVRSGVTSSR
jgi:hypothetical protein